jgi:hypothetical protein
MVKAEKLLNEFRELTDVRKQQVIDFVVKHTQNGH